MVFAATNTVGWNDHRCQTVNLLEFISFGIGSARHATQFAVQTEIVLECDGRHGLVFGLNGDTFLGFHSLMQSIAPTATCHETAGEFVNNDNFTLLHHIVLIAVVDVIGAQSSREVVHERNVGGVVKASAFRNQARAGQNALGVFMTLFSQENLVGFFVYREIARLDDTFACARIGLTLLARQHGHHLVHGVILRRVVVGLAADDERCARFVDQNGVNFVNDGVIEAALHAVFGFVNHVVTQVVKTKFVVGTVCDV